ncbi:paraquat-inducible protein A [Poriferisphaera corsica]|uniref:paraquat-inducible protein A n=1 Tax=Poriferisphaera corsica TaxID=2528020 RepID=UPI0011A8E747|nr:paraquat-inducible protein A [Poriferisphaera corsica]
MNTNLTTLHSALPRYTPLITTLWLISFSCNVAALLTPFLRINLALSPTRIYSLPHTVQLMWEAKLYLVAALIVGFSIIFPFIKLALIAITWLHITSPHKRQKTIAILETLGKWSMLDIFIVCILLVLTTNQVVISSAIRFGVYLFLIAITLSMITSLIIQTISRPIDTPNRKRNDTSPVCIATKSSKLSFLYASLWLLALIALLTAIGFPYFRIQGFFFNQHAYSIFRTTTTLFKAGAPIFAAFLFLVLIITPFLHLIFNLLLYLGDLTPKRRHLLHLITHALTSWSMLDVFALALLIFLLEGHSLIKTAIRPGLILLVIAVILLTIISHLLASLQSKHTKI